MQVPAGQHFMRLRHSPTAASEAGGLGAFCAPPMDASAGGWIGKLTFGLQQLRDAFQTRLNHGSIKKHGSSLQMAPSLQQRLEDLRSPCIAELNGVLRLAGLRPA